MCERSDAIHPPCDYVIDSIVTLLLILRKRKVLNFRAGGKMLSTTGGFASTRDAASCEASETAMLNLTMFHYNRHGGNRQISLCRNPITKPPCSPLKRFSRSFARCRRWKARTRMASNISWKWRSRTLRTDIGHPVCWFRLILILRSELDCPANRSIEVILKRPVDTEP